MKKINKLAILISIAVMTLIITAISSYAWIAISNEKEVSKLITELDSTRIFESSMKVELNNEEIQYSNFDLYNTKTHMFTFKDINELKKGFKVYTTIEAKKRIKVRFKIVEEWHNASGEVITNPNYVTYHVNDMLKTYPNDMYIYYENSIKKEEIKENIQIIDFVQVKENIDKNKHLNFTIIVEAVQYNYEQSWEAFPTHINKEKIVLDKKTTVKISFKNVFQIGILRGILVEFVNQDKAYQFVYSENNNDFKVTIDKGVYDAYVYTHKLFQYEIKINNNELIVMITYKPLKNYEGVHGLIFSPNIIREFKTHTYYPKGSIVYTVLEDETKKYWIATQEIPANNSQVPSTSFAGWEIMGKRWNQGNVVEYGKVVYYDGTFWQSTQSGNNSSIPGSINSGWKRLDNQWFLNNQYKIGDVVLYNNVHWMTVTDGNNYAIPGSDQNFEKFTSLGYKYVKNARSSYKDDDIVFLNGIYYQVLNSRWKDPDTIGHDGNDGWITLGYNWDYEKQYKKGDIVKYDGKTYELITDNEWDQKPTDVAFWKEVHVADPDIWNANKVYNANDFVTYKGESYLLKTGYNQVKGMNAEPGKSIQWRKLTENFDFYNNYKQLDKYSLVFYKDAWWKWNYQDTSDNVKYKFNGINPLPGEIYEGISYWQEVTITWKPYNQYHMDDMVIYGGHFYRAKVDINDFKHVGDVQFWERYDIDWNPNV